MLMKTASIWGVNRWSAVGLKGVGVRDPPCHPLCASLTPHTSSIIPWSMPRTSRLVTESRWICQNESRPPRPAIAGSHHVTSPQCNRMTSAVSFRFPCFLMCDEIPRWKRVYKRTSGKAGCFTSSADSHAYGSLLPLLCLLFYCCLLDLLAYNIPLSWTELLLIIFCSLLFTFGFRLNT